MNKLQELWEAALFNPKANINRPGRLMGRHCVARKLRAQAKREKRGKTPYDPR